MPLTPTQNNLRKELLRAENGANNAMDWHKIYIEIGWEQMADKQMRHFHHFMGRRSLIIAALCSAQIKEFNYE